MNERINEIFSRLEGWHLIIRSEQAGPSPQGSHGYLPKRYLFDTGVLRHLRESAVPSVAALSMISSAARTPLGGVLENQTAVDILRSFGAVSGWKKSSSGTEIDFVLKRAESSIPVECKATSTINKRHLRGIVDYLDFYSIPSGVILSFAPRTRLKAGQRTVDNIPAYLAENLGELAR
jgi:predicted AAA+ superfamily ATPase